MNLRPYVWLVLLYLATVSVFGAGLKEMNAPPEPESARTIALVGARLIDGNGGSPIENAVVLIRGSKIIAAGKKGSISVPNSAVRMDINGHTILPGLIDTHFHSKNNLVRPVDYELEKGITAFRDPGHPWKYYDNVLAANITMPRIFMCGGHLDGTPPVWADQAVVPKSRAETREAVYSHVDRGASCIKVYLRLPLEFIAAACEAARERGVPVTSHLELVDADDAIQAGVRGIEHITSFGTSIAAEEDVARFKSEVFADSNARNPLRPWLWSRINLDHNPRVKPLLDLVVETGTFVSPTMAIFEARTGKKKRHSGTGQWVRQHDEIPDTMPRSRSQNGCRISYSGTPGRHRLRLSTRDGAAG